MKRKTRIAFFPPSDNSWLGGVNYYKNLFYAVNKYASDQIELVVFLSKKSDQKVIDDYSNYINECHLVDFLDKKKISGFLCKVEYRLFATNRALEFVLKKFKIDLISHSSYAGFKQVRSIGWIPDFQHIHLPQMFTKADLNKRNKGFKNLINKTDAVFVSSYDALNDAKKFLPGSENKIKVLQFVSQPEEEYFELNDENKLELLSKYELSESFFYCPNQFWQHKNHMVVFQAVKLLKDKGVDITLVCTGNLKDFRAPEYIQSLLKYVSDNDLSGNIKMLGIVPYNDVFLLVKFSHAVVNPSLFEGWSSTVEECKSVNKPLIISDLNVHKEQAPNALFFDRSSPVSLANSFQEILSMNQVLNRGNSANDLEDRTRNYAETYCKAIKSVI